MSLTPRKTLNDNYIDGMTCAICGNSNLKIVHIEVYPDFVLCEACNSAFVVEDEGNWIMYGKISSDYPKTNEFAHRQWTWLQAVAERAEKERNEWEAAKVQEDISPPQIEEPHPKAEEKIPTSIPEPAKTAVPHSKVTQAHPSLGALLRKVEQAEKEAETAPPEPPTWEPEFAQPGAESQVEATQAARISHLKTEPMDEVIAEKPQMTGRPEQVFEEAIEMELEEEPLLEEPSPMKEWEQSRDERIQEQKQAEPVSVSPTGSPQPFEWNPSEPEPSKRYQVIVRGDQLKHPKNLCAHCLRQPDKEFTVPGSLPDMNRPGKRKAFAFELPLCRDCLQRSKAVGEEEKNAKLLAKLVSALIALISMVALLALGLVKLNQQPLAGIFFLLSFAALSYTLASLLLHKRASRYPPPEDAAFVLSTLLIEPAGEGATKFEWRNPQYAQLFQQVNHGNVNGEIDLVEDRFARVRPKQLETIETHKSAIHQQPPKTPETTNAPESKLTQE